MGLQTKSEASPELSSPAGSRPLQRRRRPLNSTLADWLGGLGVLVICTAAQQAFRQGPQPFDSAKYFQTAVDFPDVPADLWTLRIGLVAPVRLAVLVFGPSEAALYAVPLVAGLLLAGAVYGTMLLLFHDRLLAAAAALVTALNTDLLLRWSAILPDTAAAATFTAGVFFLVLGARQHGWLTPAWAACAGFVFGWTYLIREFSLILVPVVVVAIVLLRYPLRRGLIVVGTALAIACLELAYGSLRHTDPFIHIRLLVTRAEQPRASGRDVVFPVRDELDSLVDTLAVFPRLLFAWETGWAVLLLMAIFVVALVARFRDRRLWLLSAWGVSFWLTMALLGLGSFPSGRWLLNITSVRYWFPLFPPLVMGAFAGIGLLLSGHRRLPGGLSLAHVAAVAVAALVLGPTLAEFERCSDRQTWPNDPTERWHELRSWFATAQSDRFDLIVTDLHTLRLVPAFTSTTFGRPLWDGDVEELPPGGAPRGALVLVHKDRLGASDRGRVGALVRGRTPVFVSHDGEMVLLADTSAATGQAAEVPPGWWRLAGEARAPRQGTCGARPYP